MTAMITLEFTPPVAIRVLSSPPMNALSPDLIGEIETALDQVTARGDIHILRIRSSGKAFCAGADLGVVSAIMAAADPGQEMARFVGAFHRLNHRLAALDAITIAEIEGAAVGGGLELALACDFRVATERARLGLPEAKLGLIPAAGGTFRLRQIAGLPLARRLILKGDIIGAEEAMAQGLVDAVLRGTEEDIRAGFEAFAATIAGNGTAAVLAAKRCLAAPPEHGEEAEIEAISDLVSDPETRKRVNAFLRH